ncbi:high glucose sensor Rgt2p [Diutina rugosa]
MWHLIEKLLYDNSEEEQWQKMRQKSSSRSAFVVGLVAAMGGFLYGYDTGLINDILEMEYVKQTFPANRVMFTAHERAVITAMLSLGTFFGAIGAPLWSDKYGRKNAIIMSAACVFSIGNVVQTASYNIAMMCVGRFVSGLSVGVLSAVVPLYQAEASPKWVRGSIVFTYQWAITWGLLISSAICQGTRHFMSAASYRLPIGLQFVWALCLSCGMLFLPESPRYYVQKNQLEKALNSLSHLRKLPEDDPDLIEELVEIKANYDYEMSFGKTSYLDCFRSGGGRHKQVLRMWTGIGVQAFQQCTGINFVFYFGLNFFNNISVPNAYIMSFTTYCTNTVFSVPGILLIDVIGRRKLLMVGGVGMAVSNLIIGILGVTIHSSKVKSAVCVSFSCLFIAFFASTWGGVAWALPSDIFGISIRQKAISLTTATNWLMNFIFCIITPYLIDTGKHTAKMGTNIFFLWGGLNIAGTIFSYLVVYETRGLKLEEVDYMYMHCRNARESTKFQSTKIDYDNYDSTAMIYTYSDAASTTSGSSEPSPLPKDTLAMIPFSNSSIDGDSTSADLSKRRRTSSQSSPSSSAATPVPAFIPTICPLASPPSDSSSDSESDDDDAAVAPTAA